MRKKLQRPPGPRRKKLADSKLPHGKRSARSLRTWKVFCRRQRIQRLRELMEARQFKFGQALSGADLGEFKRQEAQ